ncbi:hypothetical protein MY04_3862 [Flammeovirga sp. MY04]|uniref:hypothetical protein n=1 Tax=Flammeovirga sp. MY04 TaxID=1191459 RepID=UPI00080637C6|nr:hypothetical protein [Flammeovirga sp. MY04]ANQ51206.1 hypothetical protein MY04_3862 [Flammeovirga sp. MY04]
MKSLRLISFSLFLVLVTLAYNAYAAVSVRYENKDSQDHTYTVEIGGSTKKVTFGKSRTATYTIQGGGSSAVIHTSCGKVTVRDGARITIKNGCISFN